MKRTFAAAAPSILCSRVMVRISEASPGTNGLRHSTPAPPHLPVRRAPQVPAGCGRGSSGSRRSRGSPGTRGAPRGVVVVGQRAPREPGGVGTGVSPAIATRPSSVLDRNATWPSVWPGVWIQRTPGRTSPAAPAKGPGGRTVAPSAPGAGAASRARPRGRGARRHRAGGAPRRGPSGGGSRGPCGRRPARPRRERGREHVPWVCSRGRRRRSPGP